VLYFILIGINPDENGKKFTIDEPFQRFIRTSGHFELATDSNMFCKQL